MTLLSFTFPSFQRLNIGIGILMDCIHVKIEHSYRIIYLQLSATTRWNSNRLIMSDLKLIRHLKNAYFEALMLLISRKQNINRDFKKIHFKHSRPKHQSQPPSALNASLNSVFEHTKPTANLLTHL
jgi:hypothetical protein